MESILPTAHKLATDGSEFVRAFFAAQVSALAPMLGRDDTVQHLLPLLLILLRDGNSEVIGSQHNSVDVRVTHFHTTITLP